MEYKKQSGFTILELMIAISVFTVAILLVTTGVIQIGREYRLGATRAKLNTFTRELHGQFTQEIQYSGLSPVIVDAIPPATLPGGYNHAICMGNTRYLIKDIDYADPSSPTLGVDTISDISLCGTQAAVNVKNPLPKDARLTDFIITPPVDAFHGYELFTRIVIGEKDLFQGTANGTDGDFSKPCVLSTGFGSAFCSTIILSSNIARKVKNV
jgi:prepilin-type N-terminal cleavage/methylation domain-containing protein